MALFEINLALKKHRGHHQGLIIYSSYLSTPFPTFATFGGNQIS